MTREERQTLAAEDRADGADFDEECDRRYGNATCACGFELYGCPYHDSVMGMVPQSLASRWADSESARSEPLGYLERLRRHDARGRTAYGFDACDDEGYSCDDFADERLPPAPSVTADMMRAAFMAWRP